MTIKTILETNGETFKPSKRNIYLDTTRDKNEINFWKKQLVKAKENFIIAEVEDTIRNLNDQPMYIKGLAIFVNEKKS